MPGRICPTCEGRGFEGHRCSVCGYDRDGTETFMRGLFDVRDNASDDQACEATCDLPDKGGRIRCQLAKGHSGAHVYETSNIVHGWPGELSPGKERR